MPRHHSWGRAYRQECLLVYAPSRGSLLIDKVPAFLCYHMLLLESVSAEYHHKGNQIESPMCPDKTTKEVYSSPEMDTIQLATTESLLLISNPGGTVPGIDPDED